MVKKQNKKDIIQGLDHVLKLNNYRQKEILYYEFGVPKASLKDKKRPELIDLI